MRDTFSTYHPLANGIYFAVVILLAMCLMHPVFLVISLGSGLYYRYQMGGHGGNIGLLRVLLPTMALAAIMNPMFNHEGATILTYLPSNNPLTLESILYGLAAAMLLGGVICWFSCYSQVMTSDKFIYLFGRVIPSLSLILSMTLRFVPKFQEQLRAVEESQICLRGECTSTNLFNRLKRSVTVLSIMITWALENAIDTADSMKSRGYGLLGRTAFSIYRFERRDRNIILWVISCGIYILVGWWLGAIKYEYFPIVKGITFTPYLITIYATQLALCLTPIYLSRKEGRVWK